MADSYAGNGVDDGVTCSAGQGSHDASGDDTTCDSIVRGKNKKVVSHMCTACPAGKTYAAPMRR